MPKFRSLPVWISLGLLLFAGLAIITHHQGVAQKTLLAYFVFLLIWAILYVKEVFF